MRNILILASFACLTACTTPAYFEVPNQQFISPTVAGEGWKGEVGGGLEGPTFVVTVENIDVTPPSNSGSGLGRTGPLSSLVPIFLDLRVGIVSKFEIGWSAGLLNLKYQFLGSSRKEAKEKEWVGAVAASGFSSGSKATSQTTSANTCDVSASGSGASVIMGYKVTKEVVVYGNGNFLDFSADTTVNQGATQFKYSGSGSQYGFLGGVRYEQERGFYAALEWAYTHTKFESITPTELGSIGYEMGWAW